jgi:hypothetical protein
MTPSTNECSDNMISYSSFDDNPARTFGAGPDLERGEAPVSRRYIWGKRCFWIAFAGTALGVTIGATYLAIQRVTGDLDENVGDLTKEISDLTEVLQSFQEKIVPRTDFLLESIATFPEKLTAQAHNISQIFADVVGPRIEESVARGMYQSLSLFFVPRSEGGGPIFG